MKVLGWDMKVNSHAMEPRQATDMVLFGGWFELGEEHAIIGT